jgi:hypothetical protein
MIVLPVETDRDKATIRSDKMVDDVGPRAECGNERPVAACPAELPPDTITGDLQQSCLSMAVAVS